MINPTQAHRAFIRGRRSVRFYTIKAPRFLFDKAWVWLERVWVTPAKDEWDELERSRRARADYDDYWNVAEPDRLRQLLERADLTRCAGRPLVAGSERHQALALAAGPTEAPKRIQIGSAFDLERGVLGPATTGQPEWWVLEAEVADPFHGGTDAKAWSRKWKAQAEAGETPSWD